MGVLYRCAVRCQWRRQLWTVGDMVECDGGSDTPPSAFFEAIEPDEVPNIENDDSETMKPRRGRKKKEDEGDGPGGGE